MQYTPAYNSKQRGNMMILVIGGVVVLVGALAAVYIMTMKKANNTLPTMQNPQTQQNVAPNTPVQSPGTEATAQGSDDLTTLDKDLNDTNASLNTIDEGSDSVLGIATQIDQ